MNTRLQKSNTKESGYSLVETIIYMALFATLSTVLISGIFGMSRAYQEARVNEELLASAHTSLERMSREIRNATGIASGVFDISPGELVLNALEADGDPKTVTFSVSEDNVLELLDSTDGTPRELSGQRMSVDSLVFRQVTTPVGHAIRVEVTFRSLRSTSGRDLSLTNTIVLRGDYE